MTRFHPVLLLFLLWSAIQGVPPVQAATNVYHTNRVFVATTSSIAGVTTAYKLSQGAAQLTEIVGVTNVIVDTNATKAVEYEGFAWGHESANAAWTSAVSVYQSYYMNHTGMIYDNVGWVKGTREAYGTWGAFLWYLQNQIAFKTSETNAWVSPGGAVTNYFVKVYVSSLGDYVPMTNVVDVGPTNWAQITNYLGAGGTEDAVYKAILDTYYQLLTTRFLENTQQLYGFDAYTDPNMFYKSVETGKTDTVFTDIYPTDYFAQVYFRSTNTSAVAVDPSRAQSQTQTVSMTGGTSGAAELHANGGSISGPRTGCLNVLAYPRRTNSVAIRLVHEDNDDMQVVTLGTAGLATNAVVISPGANGFRDTIPAGDDVVSANDLDIMAGPNGVANTIANAADILSTGVSISNAIATLNNRVYNQAVFEWNVVVLPDTIMNFDLNRNGALDVPTSGPDWMSAEMSAISNSCKDTAYAYNVFLVDHPSVPGLMGIMDFGQPYGFVFGDVTPHIPTTIAHELGHGAFGLTHPGGLGVPVNIMTQGSQTKWRTFRNQWKVIQLEP